MLTSRSQAFLALLDSGINYRGENVGCYTSAVSHDLFMLSGQASRVDVSRAMC